MTAEKPTSKPAKILYRPVGIVSGVLAGLIASTIFKQLWKRLSPAEAGEAPKPLQSEYRMREVVLAAVVQGAIFSGVRAVVDRGGARAFERWSGEWPGD